MIHARRASCRRCRRGGAQVIALKSSGSTWFTGLDVERESTTRAYATYAVVAAIPQITGQVAGTNHHNSRMRRSALLHRDRGTGKLVASSSTDFLQK
jgi:hypothetical protein